MLAHKRIAGALAIAASIAALVTGAGIATATTASASTCTGTWSLGIGGLGDNTANLWAGRVNQRVGYQSADTESGVAAINTLITQHRAECPSDTIELGGYSGGAAAAHIWANRHPNYGNILIDLYGDPKNPVQTGGPGFAQTDLFWFPGALAGSDNYYGGNNVIEHCNPADHICHGAADWSGYLWGGSHSYNLQVR